MTEPTTGNISPFPQTPEPKQNSWAAMPPLAKLIIANLAIVALLAFGYAVFFAGGDSHTCLKMSSYANGNYTQVCAQPGTVTGN